MNSRERLLTAINCGTPDRVPISTYELVGYNSRSFENQDQSYAKVMDYIRKKTDCVCMWNPDSDDKLLFNAYPVECKREEIKDGDRTIRKNTFHTPQGDLTQTMEFSENVYTVWQTEHLCKSTEDVDKLLSIPFVPVKYDYADFDRIKNEVGDNGIIMPTIPDPMLLAADLMEFGEFTMWALTEMDHFAKTIQIMHERNMQNLKNMLEERTLDLYRICGPEYATPPYLHPDFFRQFVLPYVKEMTEFIHSKGGKVRIHCHGRIGQILDMMLETGADAIDPCEAPPDGDIILSEVKKKCAGKMCVFGNVQLKLLENGSGEDVKAAVKECMDYAKAGGGYIIMPTAAPINTPISKRTEENYFHYIDTALEFGKY